MEVTERLARFALELSLEELPAKVVDTAKLRILDTLAVASAGSQAECTRVALEVVRDLGGRPVATVIAHGDRTSVPQAALVNGMAAHALELDDLSSSGVVHTSPTIVPAMLAIAESNGAGGKPFLEACVAGFEIATRITWGMMGASFLARGWHSNSVIGVIGCAAAAGRLLGCDFDQTRFAMGTAGSCSSGIRKNVGTMTKPFHMAHAARNGVVAAMLAKRGFTADPSILEQSPSELSVLLGMPDKGHEYFSFPQTYAGGTGYDAEAALRGLGEEYELGTDSTLIRFHPCATFGQPAIDETIDLVMRHDIRPEEVERVEVGVTPTTIATEAGAIKPPSGLKARWSLTFGISVAVLDREAGLRQYSDERVRRPDLHPFMERVHLYVPEEYAHLTGGWGKGIPTPASARILIELKDGRRFSGERHHTRGFPEEPATWSDVVRKYEECAEGVFTPAQVRRSAEMVAEIDRMPDVRRLVAELVST